MKKNLHFFIISALLLCEALFFGGGNVFAVTNYTLTNNDQVLTITNSGAMDDYNSASSAPWYSKRTSIKRIIVKDNVTKIGKNAFYGCSNATSVQISPTVTEIGADAFKSCSKIDSIKYQKNSLGSSESDRTTVSTWAQISFTNENSNPLAANSSGGNLYCVQQSGQYSNGLLKVTFLASLGGCNLGSISTINNYAFVRNKSISYITFSTNVTTIGSSAFKNCTALTKVQFGTDATTAQCNVTSIGSSAFGGCTAIDKIIVYGGIEKWLAINFNSNDANPLGASTAATRQFYVNGTTDAYKVTTPTISNNIPSYAFYNNNTITSITINEGVIVIGNYAFKQCSALENISLPSTIATIGSDAFYNCNALTSYSYASDIEHWINIDFGSANSNPMNKVHKCFIGNSEQTSIVIPYGVSTIKARSFAGCTALTSVTLPVTLTSCGTGAFDGCSSVNLTNVDYLGSITDWCKINFANAAANPARYSGSLRINGVEQTDIYLEDNLAQIKDFAFYNNTALTRISINGSTSIAADALTGCSAELVLRGTVSGSCGSGVTWLLSDNGVLTISGTGAGTMTNYTNNTHAPWVAYKSIITQVVIEEGVTSIGNYAFNNCSNIRSISLPEGLQTIGNNAFNIGSPYLTEIVIPSTVTTIGSYAFRLCGALEKVTVLATSPLTSITARTVGSSSGNSYYYDIFADAVFSTAALYVPISQLANYKAANGWKLFTHFHISGTCGAEGDNVQYDLNITTGTLTISGTGAIADYNTLDNRAPWYDLRSNITSIKICDGVTHVGRYAFNGCSTATEVWMSTTVTGCGASAFLNCSDLTKVKYGKTGSTILSYATDWAQIEFANYQANPLASAHVLQVYKAISTIPAFSNVTSLENRNISAIKPYAFYGCTTLTNAVLPANVETIGDDAFYGCTNLATVTLPDALTTIGKEAFKNCSTLTSITIPENVTLMTCHNGSTTYSIFGGCAQLTTIVWNARNCASDYIKVGTGSGFNYGTPFSGIYSQITSITFGENVERIPNYLCYHMDHLTSVTIPSSVTNIGTEAFDACSGTMSVICEGATPPILADNVFSSPSTKKLYLPHDIDVKAAYRAASGWSSFTEENTYPKIVQFDLNGKSGTIPDPQFFDDKTSKAAAPAIPADDGYYTFDQWTTDASGASPFTFASTNITADLTLYAKWTENIFSFADTDKDNSKIAAAEGKKASSVTIGRTVWKDGYYNTLCLPFSLSADEIATSPLAGYKALKRLSTATVTGTGENRVLNIQLEPITAITAGEPFLISYEAGENITNPVFNNVTVTAATPGSIHAGDVTCHGIYARTSLGDANTNLFLGTNNTLYWPQDAEHSTMNGLRAYFSIDSSGPAYAGMRVRLTDKPAETPTGIDHDAPSTEPQSTKILRDGVLLILRDGKTYSAQGVRIQ